jgi:hypothetical protein
VEPSLSFKKREVKKVFKTHLSLLLPRGVDMAFVQQIEMLWGRNDESPSHGVCQDDQTFHSHSDIIPTALVIFVGEVSIVVKPVVRGDRALKHVISRNNFPINDL